MSRPRRSVRTRHARALLALVVALALTAVAVPAVASDLGTVINGRVTDREGHPLAGVQVRFETIDTGFVAVAATTAANGTYRALRRTVDGAAWVSFDGRDATGGLSRAGYLTADLVDAEGRRVVIDPRPGGRVTGADAALDAGAGVRGRVTTAEGRPLANVLVDVVAEWPHQDQLPTAVTDARGIWSIRALDLAGQPSRSATIHFNAYDATGGASATGYPYACLGLVATPCERGDQFEGATPRYLQLTAGRVTTGADIALPPAAEIHGRLTDLAGRGVGGAVVDVFGEVSTTNGAPAELAGYLTAVDGTWTAGHLFPQTYAVCYGYRGNVVGTGDRNGPRYVGECAHDSPVAAGARAGTLYPLGAGQTVSVDDSLLGAGDITGRVVDELGNPVANAWVATGRYDGSGTFVATSRVRTLSRGGYLRQGLAPGNWVVCATATGFRDTCPVSSGPVTRVLVRSLQTTTAPDVVLHRAS